jgi:hypothetical protein
MNGRRNHRWAGVGALALLAVAVPADAAGAPGDHIRFGNAELVPTLGLGVQFRSNVYLVEGVESGGSPETPGAFFRIQPKLDLTWKAPDLILGAGAGWTGKKYFNPALGNLDRWSDFNLGGRLEAFPGRVVGFKLTEAFSVQGWETESASVPEAAQGDGDPDVGLQWQDADSTFNQNAYYTRLNTLTTGRVAIHPGGPLEIDAGGNFARTMYSTPPESWATSNSYFLNGRTSYGPNVEAKWRFFPKTAFVAGYEQVWFVWDDNLLDAQGGSGSEDVGERLAVPDGQLLRLTGGVRGRFTEKLVLGLVAGYGRALYDEASVLTDAAGEQVPDEEIDPTGAGFAADLKGFPEGLLVVANVQYTVQEGHTVGATYRRDFQDSMFTNYVAYNSLSFAYDGKLSNGMKLGASQGYRYESYVGEVSRQDHLLDTGITASYPATRFLAVVGRGGWTRRANADGANPQVEYDDWSAYLGVDLSY